MKKWLTNILYASIGSIFTYMLATMGSVHTETHQNLELLKTYVGNEISLLEGDYVICDSVRKLPSDSKYKIPLELSDKLRESNGLLIDQHRKIGTSIPFPTYLAIHELTCWNDHLVLSGIRLCRMDLKPPKNMDKWRDFIFAKLDQEIKRHDSMPQILKDYVSEIKHLFKEERIDTYPTQVCDLDKISKY